MAKEISTVIPGREALGNSYTKVLVGVVSAQRLLQHQQAGAKALPSRPIWLVVVENHWIRACVTG